MGSGHVLILLQYVFVDALYSPRSMFDKFTDNCKDCPSILLVFAQEHVTKIAWAQTDSTRYRVPIK